MVTFVAAATVLCMLSAQDTAVVSADGPAIWGEPLQLVEEVRIGVIDGDERYTLGRVVGVAVAPDGMIWVADGLASTIRRYDAEGRYVDSVGRSGEGPGEFSSLTALGRMSDGRFVAWDAELTRATLFTADGTVSKTLVIQMPVIMVRNNTIEQFRTDDRGRFFLFKPSLGPDEVTAVWQWLSVDSTGVVRDSVPFPGSQMEGPRSGFKPYGFGRMYAFSTLTRGVLSPGGVLVTGRNDTYALTVPQPGGRTLRITRPWTPVEANNRERAERQALVDHAGGEERVPARKPPYWAMWVDQDSRIWVARHTNAARIPETEEEREERQETRRPPSEWWEPLTLDVIEPSGRYLGTVTIPDHRTELKVARGRQIWVVEKGEFGEDYVVRYRIEQTRLP